MRTIWAGGIIATTIMLFISCEKERLDTDISQYASIIDVAGDGVTTVNEGNLKSTLTEAPAISDSELIILLNMKEEEKMARDVYLVLYEKWGSHIFSRISYAEDRHLNAIVLLLKYYGSSDTLVADTGVFSDPEVQALYIDLVEKGSVSIEEAYMTGALIEEMDINDLTDALGIVSNENIFRVLENLLKGSRNHLRAFYHQINSLGLVYTPVYISQEEYDDIVNTPMEFGHRYRIQNGGMHHHNGQGNGNNGDGNCDSPSNGNGNGDSRGNGQGENSGRG